MMPIRQPNPEHPIRMMHAALETLRLVEDLEERRAAARQCTLEDRIAGQLSEDMTTTKQLRSLTSQIQGRLAFHPQRRQPAVCCLRVGLVRQTQVKLFRHDREV